MGRYWEWFFFIKIDGSILELIFFGRCCFKSLYIVYGGYG